MTSITQKRLRSASSSSDDDELISSAVLPAAISGRCPTRIVTSLERFSFSGPLRRRLRRGSSPSTENHGQQPVGKNRFSSFVK